MPKLLIVDDEADVREFAVNFFRRRKLEAITASGAQEALAIIKKQNPTLILLDIRMKGIDGIETLRRIKELDKDAKVIMVSGRKPDEEQAYQRCRELGALNYIHKPLKLEELESVVFEALKNGD